MPPKHDLRLIDEHIESVSMDVISNIAPSDVKTVKTIDVNHKGMFSTEEPKPVMKNNFSPLIIKDWHSYDESEVEISPIVEVNIVKPSIEKIKFVKTARETVKNEESPKQHKHHPNHVSKQNSASLNHKRFNYIDVQGIDGLSTKLFDRVLDLEKIKTAQAKKIDDLKKRVKNLERKEKVQDSRDEFIQHCDFKVQAMIDADYKLAGRLRAEEQRRKTTNQSSKEESNTNLSDLSSHSTRSEEVFGYILLVKIKLLIKELDD
nr:hypothetical protein [Tanacetum cinerariifolium]